MSQDGAADPTPLSAAQLRALAAAAGRELCWGLHAVSRELRVWRAVAAAIPDARLRADALHSLDHKRGHADGAALFTILPRWRDPRLLRLLVAYETMVDYLDNVSERHPTRANGEQLHGALADALDPDAPLRDWYRHHPAGDDDGYLATLVGACRDGCRALPSYERVRPLLARDARLALVLGINHDPDPVRRDAALREWAAAELPDERDLTWFELSGAASATLSVLALLALAADPALCDADVDAVHAAYWPWISLATTMLDSWVDARDDTRDGHHSYVAHYGDADAALPLVREAIARGTREARALPNGHRHAVIVGCMVAMYLSKDSARTPAMRDATHELAAAGGSLARLLMPMLRGWRLAYGPRSSPRVAPR
jgi:tetraprenyl-beta-curcumene synthase